MIRRMLIGVLSFLLYEQKLFQFDISLSYLFNSSSALVMYSVTSCPLMVKLTFHAQSVKHVQQEQSHRWVTSTNGGTSYPET